MSNVLLNKNHEEYLITNMRRLQYRSPADAKAWMVTAKSLFPDDFCIQFESYKMERDYKNAKQAAQYFTELMEKFPDEAILLNEMKIMADSLSLNSQFTDPVFVKDIFQNLSNTQKYKVLTSVANHCTEPMDHCSLMLLLLQELPSQLYQHGEKVINTLLKSEKLSRCESPVNPFRKLLICDAMPAILSSPNFKMNSKLLFTLMQSAIEFFICYVFNVSEEDADTDFAKIMQVDTTLASKVVHKVWKPLFILMKIGGQQLQWELVELFSSQNKFLDEMNWEMILSVIRKKMCSSDHGSLATVGSYNTPYDREVFICSIVIFFYSLYQFAKLIGPKLFFKSISSDIHYVLIEGIHALTEGDGMETVSKKFKYDRDAKKLEKNPPITVSHNLPTDMADAITQSFITSIKMWNLIQRNFTAGSEFSMLCKIIEMEKWSCFQEFYIDMLMHQSHHKEAISHLMDIIQVNNDEFIKNKARLQLASCMNYIGEHVKACECLFDIICAFPYNQSTTSGEIQLPPARTTHHLTFISFSLDVILSYCIELLICIYKKKLKIGVKESVMLGHIVILSQYRWPREEEFFLQCIRTIQMSDSFCYGKFFDYIIVPSILEEFMFLTTPEGGNVTLDLLPTSTTQIGKQRAVTRGVNKGAKEDLRENMKKQMARCEENLNDLFVIFIQQERYCIKRIIM